MFRGLYAPLTVKDTWIAPDVRPDGYDLADKPLHSIPHDSGFLVRAVSAVYANTEGVMRLNNMTNIGPTERADNRLQMGTAMLGSPGVFGGTVLTNNAFNAADVVPDMALILDEER